MRIVYWNRIAIFIREHPNSKPSLNAWVQIMERNTFTHFTQLRQTFSSADYVKSYTIFNISGNRVRLITLINYTLNLISVEQVLTHAEYDKKKWRS
ncbi:MAG: type II toxin-antitoxin system HigB family toxin [Elusimicrobia bacterium]|nr:type II toxin-antitoxin system HigB family toxin [Elusimicrobiota bacterium]